MISRKARPTDGPGANHLRGGARLYSDRTATPTWMDEHGGSALYKRSFTTDRFETEAEHQQSGGVRPPRFGADLPLEELVIKPKTVRDLFNPTETTTWETNTQQMMKSLTAVDNRKQPPVAIHRNENPNDEYRQNWTIDTPEGRKLRFFAPESRRANNAAVPEDFQVESIRMLPGTPFACEQLLRELVKNYGSLGISALKSELGNAEISTMDFKVSLKKLRVNLSRVEQSQLLAYLTRGDRFHPRKLYDVLTPRTDLFDPSTPSSIYHALFGSAQCISEDDVKAALMTDMLPDVAEGIREFIHAYLNPDGRITEEEFIQLHDDMLHSVPRYYLKIVECIWST